MAKSLTSQFAARQQDLRDNLTTLKRTKAKAKAVNLDKVFSALLAVEPNAEIYMYTYCVTIDIPVVSMKHMLEALEFIQLKTGIEFDKTTDLAEYGIRSFTSTNGQHDWLHVRALVSKDTDDAAALCKRKLTGYKTVEQPVYELECLDQTVLTTTTTEE